LLGSSETNLLGIVEFAKSSAVERFCRDALAVHARLFRLWHKFRGAQISRQQLMFRAVSVLLLGLEMLNVFHILPIRLTSPLNLGFLFGAGQPIRS
jgi:hypothetical protein